MAGLHRIAYTAVATIRYASHRVSFYSPRQRIESCVKSVKVTSLSSQIAGQGAIGDVRSVLLYAEMRAVISLKRTLIRPYYVTIRWHFGTPRNRKSYCHGTQSQNGLFIDSTARTSAYNNAERMRTRIQPVLFVLGIGKVCYQSCSKGTIHSLQGQCR